MCAVIQNECLVYMPLDRHVPRFQYDNRMYTFVNLYKQQICTYQRPLYCI